LEKLQTATSGAPTPAPSKEKRKSDSVIFRAKKNVASKAATSGAGKKAISKVIPPAVNNMLNTLEIVLEKIAPDRAKGLYNTLIKVMVKANFQVDKKTLTLDDFQPLYRPLRAVFEELCKSYDKYQKGEGSTIEWTLVTKYFQSIEGVLSKLMRPYMKPANILKLKEFFDFMGSKGFQQSLFESPKVATEVKELITFFREYSAWEDKYENFTPMKISLGGLLVLIADEPQLTDEQILNNLLSKK